LHTITSPVEGEMRAWDQGVESVGGCVCVCVGGGVVSGCTNLAWICVGVGGEAGRVLVAQYGL